MMTISLQPGRASRAGLVLASLLVASMLLTSCGYDKEEPTPTLPPATVITAPTEPTAPPAPAAAPAASATPLPKPPQVPAQQTEQQDRYPYGAPSYTRDGTPFPTVTPYVYPTP